MFESVILSENKYNHKLRKKVTIIEKDILNILPLILFEKSQCRLSRKDTARIIINNSKIGNLLIKLNKFIFKFVALKKENIFFIYYWLNIIQEEIGWVNTNI